MMMMMMIMGRPILVGHTGHQLENYNDYVEEGNDHVDEEKNDDDEKEDKSH